MHRICGLNLPLSLSLRPIFEIKAFAVFIEHLPFISFLSAFHLFRARANSAILLSRYYYLHQFKAEKCIIITRIL